MNKVILCGNLTRDVEIRDAANDTTIARVGIAVNRRTKNKDDVDFFNLVAFNKRAEFLEKYFQKGSKILVEGILRSSTYTDKEGIKRTSIEIIIDQIEFADSKKKDSDGQSRSPDARDRDRPNKEPEDIYGGVLDGEPIDLNDAPF